MSAPGFFVCFALRVSEVMGRPAVFAGAVGVVLLWLLLGPVFAFSDTWQLTMNTLVAVVTFLTVILIHRTQNRAMMATQLKLDELLRAVEGAHTRLVDLENASEQELVELRARYRKLAESIRAESARGMSDTGTPSLEDLERPRRGGDSTEPRV